MKPKRRKQAKPRNTLAKQISNLPTPTAKQVAKHGRTLSRLESTACGYMAALHLKKLCDRGVLAAASSDIWDSACRRTWEKLSVEIMAVIQGRNGDALRILANVVESYDVKATADPTRYKLLDLKESAQRNGTKFTIGHIAKCLKMAGADLSRLRLIAKEIGLPLARGKVGRPRKP